MFKKKASKISRPTYTAIWDQHGGFAPVDNGKPSIRESATDNPTDSLNWLIKFKKALKYSPAAFGALLDRVQKAGEKDVSFAIKSTQANVIPPSKSLDELRTACPTPSKLSTALNKAVSTSKSASSSFSRSMSAILSDEQEPVNTLREQSEATFGKESEHITQWFAMSAEEFDPAHVLVALTTAELKRLEGATVDGIEYLRNEYQIPPPSRATSDAGDPDDEVDQYLTDNCIDSPQTNCKDLRKILGPYPGFYIVGGITQPGSFDITNNHSDYYGMPLVEPELKWGSNQIKDQDELPTDDSMSDTSTAVSTTSLYDYCELQQVAFKAPRSQAPGQALIIYLLFRGTPINEICKKLGTLNVQFLHKCESRWWKLDRVPEHSQLNDNIVEKVLKIAKAAPRVWEEEVDKEGKPLPQAMRDFYIRMHDQETTALAKKCVENYFA
jgi:hypothetical protein